MFTDWPPGAGRAVDVDAQVGRVEREVDVVGDRQHRHRDGAGVDAALRLGGGDALHAVHAGLVLELAVRAVAGDLDGDLREPADLRRVAVEHLGPQPEAGGVAQVGVEQLGGEQRGLVAAGGGADLEDGVAVVVGVARQERVAELVGEGGLMRATASSSSRARSANSGSSSARASAARVRCRSGSSPARWPDELGVASPTRRLRAGSARTAGSASCRSSASNSSNRGRSGRDRAATSVGRRRSGARRRGAGRTRRGGVVGPAGWRSVGARPESNWRAWP